MKRSPSIKILISRSFDGSLKVKTYHLSFILERVLKDARSKDRVLELRFVRTTEMRNLNHLFRGIDKSTDVLSFPMRKQGVLGSIVIDMTTATLQAIDLGHSLQREIDELFIHGVLHLLGYDHETKSQAKQMKQLELRYRKFLKNN